MNTWPLVGAVNVPFGTVVSVGGGLSAEGEIRQGVVRPTRHRPPPSRSTGTTPPAG